MMLRRPSRHGFNWHTDPNSKRPELLLNIGNPDDADPTSDPTVWWLSNPKVGIAYFTPYSLAADAVLAEGERQATQAKADVLYGKAAEHVRHRTHTSPIASVNTVAVLSKGITGVTGAGQAPFSVNFQELRGS